MGQGWQRDLGDFGALLSLRTIAARQSSGEGRSLPTSRDQPSHSPEGPLRRPQCAR